VAERSNRPRLVSNVARLESSSNRTCDIGFDCVLVALLLVVVVIVLLLLFLLL
jgi:hypothetical protein